MGSLTDWIQIALGIAGLLGGSAAGTYYGGVRRARLDDRRHLLTLWTAWLPLVFVSEPPTYTPNPNDSPSRREARIAISDLIAIDEINARVRMLPWRDRALWVRIVDRMILGHPPSIRVLQDAVASSKVHGGITEEHAEKIAQARGLLTSSLVLTADTTIPGHTGGRTVEDFQNHLLRRVNPTVTTRVADARSSARLWLYGPRPWSSRIQPPEMNLADQIRRLAPAS